jgi:STE24 endopeptidase
VEGGAVPKLTLLVLALTLLVLAPSAAQEPDSEPASGATSTAEPAPAAAEPSAPFDVEAATRAYLDRQTPEEKARSDGYFEGGYWLQLWGLVYGLAVAWLLLARGLSARMRDRAERITRRKPLQTALYTIQYLILTTILFFPLTVYQGFFREHKYGLATQSFGPWFKEQMIGLAVGLVMMSLLLVVLYGVFRKAPRTWWLWGSAVAVVFLMFTMLIAPVYIDPLFNKYEPLADEKVLDPILSMARASGIETERVYEFDASRQSNRISANVSGFLGTMRIRLNDNLLNRCTLSEIKAVMGHEIGHYALNHIYEMIVLFGLVLVGGFAFIRWGFDRANRRWGERWGVRGIGDVAGFPLLVALLSIYFFVMTPINNTIIRTNEVEADLYGLNAAREPDGFAETALKLGEYRKLEPGPIEEWLMYDHPSGRARIEMAMRWKAEHPDG